MFSDNLVAALFQNNYKFWFAI